MARSKYYMPLESNPEVFTNLINNLGLDSLQFTDVYSLTDPDILSFLSRPALALVLIFPYSQIYNQWRTEKEQDRLDYQGKGEDEEVIWYKQTIGNACGLYGILHAVSNEAGTSLSSLIQTITPLSPKSRAIALEESRELETAHSIAGKQGDTAPPDRPDANVDYHYICFVPSHQVSSDGTRKVFELDGAKKGPVDTGVKLKEGEDVLHEKVLGLVQEYIQREEEGAESGKVDIGFSLMALVSAAVER